MGCCISTSSQSTCSSNSNGERAFSPSCSWSGLCSRMRSKRTFADCVPNMQHLSSIPNRICNNGKSQSSCIFTQQGFKGVNQDAMIVWDDFKEGMTFCGIFDGHGPQGHLVSRKVRDSLPVKLLSFLNQMKLGGSGGALPIENDHESANRERTQGDDCSSDYKLHELWKEAFLRSYKAMDKELKSHSNMDCFCSGSTAVTIVKQGSDLFMASIGDSRAIMCTQGEDDSLVAIQLTVDLKPDLPREAERIAQCKGRVFALEDEPEVPRVWLPSVDAPGLAMARAFGDFCLKEYGVICIPEFGHRTLTERDKFIVLASDGVWDVLSNEEVVEIVSSAPSQSSTARLLVESAAREWRLKYPTSKMDDCAVVCLFLDSNLDSEPPDNDDQSGGFFSPVTVQSTRSGDLVAAAGSNDGHEPEPCLQRNVTVRTSEENSLFRRLPVELEANGEESGAVIKEEANWSGLDGVTRVNSLVQLPRYSSETVKSS